MKKIIKKVIGFLLVLALFASNMPKFSYETYAEEKTCIVKATSVNVRNGAGTTFKLLGQVNAGDKLIITGQGVDNQSKVWYKINFNGKAGYIREDFVYFPKTYVYDETFERNLSLQGFPDSYKEYLRLLHAEYPLWSFESFNTGIEFDYAVDMENQPGRSLVSAGSISSYKSDDEDKYDYVNSKWIPMDGADWVGASKKLIRYYMDPRNFLIEPYVFQFEKQTFDGSVQTLEGVKEMVKGTFLDGIIHTTGTADKLIGSNINISNGKSGVINPTGPYYNSNGVVSQGPTVYGNNNEPTVTNKAIGPTTGGVPSSNASNTMYGNQTVPIIYNANDNDIIAFSNTIIMPGASIEVALSPPMFTNIDMENQSFYFNYMAEGDHTYAELIYDACCQVGINPYVVIALILQEQGKDGNTASVNGKNKKYPGVYNYGNVGAYAGNGNTAVENGLLYASKEGAFNRPWNTQEKGIYGIIDYYANSFIRKGQDTFYLKKWNVQGATPYDHQYMTNVLGGAREGQILSQAYDDVLKNSKHIFKIPLYKNMPEVRCEKPLGDGNPNNKLKTLSVDGFVLSPGFDRSIYEYTVPINENTTSVNIQALRYTAKTNIVGKGKVNIAEGVTKHSIVLTAENGAVREYIIYFYKPSAVAALENLKNQAELTIPAVDMAINIGNLPSGPADSLQSPIAPVNIQ